MVSCGSILVVPGLGIIVQPWLGLAGWLGSGGERDGGGHGAVMSSRTN